MWLRGNFFVLQYSGNKDSDETTKVKHLALTQFAGMAQGDTRTQTIRLQNRSEHQANFILPKQRSMRYRHKIWLPGGVYPFRLQVGKNLTTADSLLFASSDTNKKKSSKLKHFEYVTTLDAGNKAISIGWYRFFFFCLVRIAFGVDFWQGKCYNWGWNRATAIPLALDGGLR